MAIFTIESNKLAINTNANIVILLSLYILFFKKLIPYPIVNIATAIPIYNTYGILNLVIKGIITIPLINSILSVLLYNLFKTSILKLKED